MRRATFGLGVIFCGLFVLVSVYIGLAAPQGSWVWMVASMAIGAVPVTYPLRIKDAQDARRGGPSF